jgi:hypothetical protein
MLVDATSARIPWEMVVVPAPPPDAAASDGVDRFLGTSRGLTRQLRTQFSPPPDPPLPPRRKMRVLVVADPSADDPLPAAEAEGFEVAELFTAFNTAWAGRTENTIEVQRLLGPDAATPTNVLREVLTRTYDVLHFAGHCRLDVERPAASGWVFSDGEVLAVDELRRVDRVPRFVFSNACQSGVTPDRTREAALAPTFAEAFFERGVANFVCTAWPVNDRAAGAFALTLYAHLLGLRPADAGGWVRGRPTTMHEAMRAARLRVMTRVDGGRTWGAYHHYGDPHLRFFHPAGLQLDDEADGAASAPPAATERRPAHAG